MPRRRKTAFKDPEQITPRRGRRASERVNLTDELVAAASASSSERTIHDLERGLYLRIRSSGTKTWHYRQPGIGNKHAVTLGHAAELSVKEAKAKALQVRSAREQGRMSNYSSGGNSRWTVARAFDAYIATKEPSDWSRRIERTFKDIILPAIGSIKISELDGDTALKPFAALKGYYAAKTPQYILSAFLSWASFKGLVKFNVLKGRSALPRRPRSDRRPLSAYDIGRFWRACDALPEQWSIAFRLMISTGRPIHEILSLSTSSAEHWPQGANMEFGRRGMVVSSLLSDIGTGKFGALFIANGKRRSMVFQQRHWNTLREAAGQEQANMSQIRFGVERQFAACRGDLTKWDDFLRSCMTESIDNEAIVL